MTATATTRFLRRTSERSLEVHDNGVVKGSVWRDAKDNANDAPRWRTAAPNGVEYRAWTFFRTPQDAARAVVREYDRMVAR